MFNIAELPELEISDKLYDGPNAMIVKATNRESGSREILKVLKSDTPSKGGMVRMHQEYMIASKVNSPYVATILEMVDRDSILALRMKDIGAKCLSEYLALQPLSLEHGLEVGISIL